MLDAVLKFIVNQLNAYLHANSGLNDKIVVLGPIVDDAGMYALSKNSVSLILTNIEQETSIKRQLPQAKFSQGKSLSFAPELQLNLHIMLAARFLLYDQALKYLSHILNFLQANAVFTPDNYPALDSDVLRLSLELQSLNYDQLNQIWAFMGEKHLPSVYYKVRMLSLQDKQTPSIASPILNVNNEIYSK